MRCFMRTGGSFQFDEVDYELVLSHTWSIVKGYVRTVINNKTVYFHRLIMNVDADEIDHINMDRLDNRRCNLRRASHSENQRNRGVHKDNQSGYKGVCLEKRTGRYFSYINCDGKRKYLGTYNTKEEAAAAYDQAAFFLHKKFARTNFGKEDLNEGKEEILELAESSGAGRPCA